MPITTITGPDGQELGRVDAVSADGVTLLFTEDAGARLNVTLVDARDGGTVGGFDVADDPDRAGSGTLVSDARGLVGIFNRDEGFANPRTILYDATGAELATVGGDNAFFIEALGETRVVYGLTDSADGDVAVFDAATGATATFDLGADNVDSALFSAGLVIDATADGGAVLVEVQESARGSGDDSESSAFVLDPDTGDATPLAVPEDGGLQASVLTRGDEGLSLFVPTSGGVIGTETIARVDVATGATETVVGTDRRPFDLAASADGRLVGYFSQLEGLGPVADDGATDLFVLDRATGETAFVDFTGDLTNLQPQEVSIAVDAGGVPVVAIDAFTDDDFDAEDRVNLLVDLDLIANPDRLAVDGTGGATTLDVSANDVNFGGEAVEIVAAGGGAVAVEDGRLVYTPAEGFVGADRVTYTVRDAGGAEDTGEALVLVSGDAADALFVVTTTDDAVDATDGVLSLREAILSAELRAGADTIAFAPDIAKVTLDAALLPTVTDDVTIDGGSGVEIAASRDAYGYAQLNTVLDVEGAALRLDALTLTGAYSAITGRDADITFDNSATDDIGGFSGTAIEVENSRLALNNSVVDGVFNIDGGEAAIVATDGSDVSLVESQILDGGRYQAAVTVEGGLTVDRSLFADTGGLYGGAIEVTGTLAMTNSTVTRSFLGGSYANAPSPNPDFGTIKLNAGGEGTITNSTITNSTITGITGGGNVGGFDTVGTAIAVDPDATLTLENSIVAGNTIGGIYGVPPIQADVQGTIVSNGGNIFGQDTVDGAAASDVLGADPTDLFPFVDTPYGYRAIDLADNGGPTRTVALLDDPANPAIDAAVAADAPPVDQRGFARDDAPDIGAFEAGADPVAPPPAGDALVVTTADDVVDANDGVLSLREAVDTANARAGADTITFDPGLAGATLTLVGGGLATITDDLAVDGGEGASAVTVTAARDEGDNDPTVGAIFTAENADLDLRDLTLRDANNGVTALDATVTLDRVFLDDNGGRYGGGGVSVTSSTLIVTDGTIASYGGESNAAIRAIDGSDVRLLRSEVTGGGRYQASIDVDGSLGIDQSLITATGGVDGGTIEIDGRLDVINSTVARNRLPGTYQAEPFSNTDIGVIKLDAGSTGTITNSTIAGNTGTLALAPDSYGPALLIDAGAMLELANSIVAGNLLFPDDTNGETAPFVQDVVGRIESNGRNIFSQEGVDGAAATDLQGVDPRDLFTIVEVDDRLLPDLADNGGPTRTVALLDDPANPAIDAADPADAPPVDGRGFARDAAPDVGAFEAGAGGVSPPPPAVSGVDVRFVSADADFDNTLGYYVRDAAGGFTGEAGILFAEVGDGALDPGDAAGVEGVLGDIGLFLVRDGADLGIDWDAGAVGIEDGKLIYTAPDGSDTVLQDYRVHFDFEDGQLQTSGGDDGAPVRYAWEDKALSEGSYDGDFDDAVFEVIRFIEIPAPVLPIDDGPGEVVLGGAREGAGGDDGVLL